MKNNIIKSLKVIGLILAIGFTQSCTDLTENVYDKTLASQFGTNQEQLDALVGTALR